MTNNLNNTLFGIVDSSTDGLKCTIRFLWVNPLEHHDPFDENTHVHYLVETSKDVTDKEVIAHLLKSKHRDVVITAIPCHLKRTEAALKIANMTGLKPTFRIFWMKKQRSIGISSLSF